MEVNDLISVFVEQNKSYKEMLFWALTSIITILVIFLTANFFTMRKFREDEIEKIKTAVILDMKTNSLSELKDELHKSLSLSLENEMNITKANVKNVEQKLEPLNGKILDTTGLLYELKGSHFFEKGVYSSAFSYYLKAGNTFLQADEIGRIDNVLRSLEKTASVLPYVLGDLADFNKFASQLGPEYQTQTTKIIEILKTIKTL